MVASVRAGAEPLRLRLIGRLQVEGVPHEPLPAGKAERLLKVLAAHHGHVVLSDTLVEALWPDDPPGNGARNVAVLVSRLRKSLGREHIEGDHHGYRLVIGPSLRLDLADADRLVRTAEAELERGAFGLASMAAEQAMYILEAEPALADEPDTEWVHAVRTAVADQLRRARVCRWTAALTMGDHPTAIETATSALRTDPLDEEAARTLMHAHRQAGQYGAALAVFERLRAALADELGTDPSSATQSLHQAILHAEPPPEPSRATAGRPRVSTLSLVGRDAELAELGRLWTLAAAGNGSMCVVAGEAGIGKRTLVSALAAMVSDAGGLVVTTTCFEAERSLFLQPLVEALRGILVRQTPEAMREVLGEWAGTLADLVPEIERMLGPVPYQRAGPESEHHRILDALSAVLANLGARRPVLLVIEELQNAGQSTLEALHFIATHFAGARVLVVATSQASEDEQATASLDGLVTRIELHPLGREAIAELVRRSRTSVDPERLAAWTGGSPLLLTELLRHVNDLPTAPADPDDLTAPLDLPASLRALVSDRINRSGPEVAELLQLGSVLGSAFLLDDVAELSDLSPDECARRAERAHRAHLLEVQGPAFRFSNDIVRQVAYSSTPEPIRVSRHRRAARLHADQPEAAAHQLAAAGDWDAAAQAWVVAADNAHLRFANLEALRLLGNALTSAAKVHHQRLITTIRLRRGQVYCELGQYALARDDHSAAVVLARDLMDEALEARALELLGWTALYARDNHTAAGLAEQATDLAESAAAAPGALPSSRLLLGRVRHWDGDYTGAAAAYDAVLTDDVDDETAAQVLVCRGALLQHMDRFAEARAVLEKAALLCRDNGLFRPLLQTLFFTSLARGDVGDFGGALRALERARRMLDEYGIGYYSAGVDTARSWLLRELGDIASAREIAERAVEQAQLGGGALEFEQGLHAVLAVAECELVDGHIDAAGALVEEATKYLDQPLPYRARAQLRLVEMQTRFDAGVAEQLLGLARSVASTKYEALALWHLGAVEEAAAMAERTGSDLLRAQLAPPAQAQAALDRITAALPTERRRTFLTRGRLAQTVAARRDGRPG